MIHHQKIRNRENEKVKQFKPSSERTSLSDRDTEELLGLAVLNQNITQVEKIIIRYSTYLQLNDLDKPITPDRGFTFPLVSALKSSYYMHIS